MSISLYISIVKIKNGIKLYIFFIRQHFISNNSSTNVNLTIAPRTHENRTAGYPLSANSHVSSC